MVNVATYSRKADAVSRQILEDMVAGDYRPGAMFPKEEDLASQYGVSKPTVRKAIDILVKEGRLVKLPHRGVLLPEETQPDSGTLVGQIFYVTPALSGETNEYAMGISSAIDSDAYALSVLSAHADILQYKKAYDQIFQLKPAGVIIQTGMPENMLHIPGEKFAEARIPVVSVGGLPFVPGLACDRVVESLTLNAEKVVEYAASKGYSDIALLCQDPTIAEYESAKTLRRDLRLKGLDLPEDKIITFNPSRGYGYSPNPYISPEQKVGEMLDGGFRCELLICDHDYPAVGALRAILSRGLRVPQDIAVISQCQCAVAGLSPMPLTSVDLHRQTIGRVAMELLNRRIEGYDGPAETHYVQPCIIQGETA